MEIFFHDPADIPLPPGEVHIRSFEAQAYPDGRRVRVCLEISPFQKKPSAEIALLTLDGAEAASISIIETIDPRMEMTLHLRGPQVATHYAARAELYYLEEPASPAPETGEDPALPARRVVATAETTFEIAPG